MLIRNKRLGRLTNHERLGMNAQGKMLYRCTETGDVTAYEPAEKKKKPHESITEKEKTNKTSKDEKKE